MLQEQALELMKTGVNVFLTGQGGTGKSYTVKQFISWAKNKKRLSVTGSTGMAALNIQGMTLHSWSGMGIDSVLNSELEARLVDNKNLNRRLKTVEVLIIDEISMLHSKQLELLNQILKFVRKSTKAFGGIQIIAVGDFFQLPPVAEPSEKDSRYCFNCPAWMEADFNICYLTKLYRQAEGDSLISILNAIRNDSFTSVHKELLDSCVNAKLKFECPLKLYSTNKSVDEENMLQLDKLETPLHILKAHITGNELKAKQIMKSGNISLELYFKVGAQVMITRNQTYNEYREKHGDSIPYSEFIPEFVNGSQGLITEIIPNQYITIKLLNGKLILLTPFKRSLTETNIKGDEVEVASVVSYPLRLSYAISIHKSQGQTFEEASVDLSNIFEEGQGYVALSRLKSLAGLSLSSKTISTKTIKINDTVRLKDKEFLKQSEQYVANLKLPEEQVVSEFTADEAVVVIAEDVNPLQIVAHVPKNVQKIIAKLPSKLVVNTVHEEYKDYYKLLEEKGYSLMDVIKELEITINEHKLYLDGRKRVPSKSILVHLDAIVKQL